MAGWVKLHRASIDSRVFKNPEIWRLWSWILMSVNYGDSWADENTKVSAGQMLIGRDLVANALKVPPRTVYDRLKKLEQWEMIKLESNSKGTVLSVCNWGSYQDRENEIQQRPVGVSESTPVDSLTGETESQQPSNSAESGLCTTGKGVSGDSRNRSRPDSNNQPTTNQQPTNNQPTLKKKGKKVKKVKKKEGNLSIPNSEKLNELIDSWNEIEGVAKCQKRDSLAILNGWKKVQKDSSWRERFEDVAAITKRINEADWLRGQRFFSLTWLFGTKNSERNIEKVLSGNYGQNRGSPRQDNSPAAKRERNKQAFDEAGRRVAERYGDQNELPGLRGLPE